jgi:hypothetical protein
MAVQERGGAAGPDTGPDLDPVTQVLDPVFDPDLELDPGLELYPGALELTGPARRRWRARTLISRTNRPVLAGLVTLLSVTAFTVARWDLWSRRSISRFILIGQNFAHPAQLPAGMPLRAAYGYDGQFYYRLAVNPLNFQHTAYGITVDAAYRFMRVGYPMLAWLVSFGQRSLVPYMLVAVNVAALAALGYLGAVIARPARRLGTAAARVLRPHHQPVP